MLVCDVPERDMNICNTTDLEAVAGIVHVLRGPCACTGLRMPGLHVLEKRAAVPPQRFKRPAVAQR